MSTYKNLQELNVLSNFMFNAIASSEKVAKPFFKELLSILLEREIGDVSITTQPFIPGDLPGRRGICMDVIVEEADNSPAQCKLYNVEPQLYVETNLEKRIRFYQAKKDGKRLASGEKDWGMLPDMYMIVITNYDPFGENSMIYSFENTCREFPTLTYNDGLKIIYFNTTGTKNCNESIKALLDYLNCSKIEHVTNRSIARLHNYVEDVKWESEVQHRFMTVGEWLDYEVRDAKIAAIAEGKALGLAEGRAEGRAEGLAEGLAEGRAYALLDFLADLGTVHEDLRQKIMHSNEDTLKAMMKLAATSNNLDEFLEKVN